MKLGASTVSFKQDPLSRDILARFKEAGHDASSAP